MRVRRELSSALAATGLKSAAAFIETVLVGSRVNLTDFGTFAQIIAISLLVSGLVVAASAHSLALASSQETHYLVVGPQKSSRVVTRLSLLLFGASVVGYASGLAALLPLVLAFAATQMLTDEVRLLDAHRGTYKPSIRASSAQCSFLIATAFIAGPTVGFSHILMMTLFARVFGLVFLVSPRQVFSLLASSSKNSVTVPRRLRIFAVADQLGQFLARTGWTLIFALGSAELAGARHLTLVVWAPIFLTLQSSKLPLVRFMRLERRVSEKQFVFLATVAFFFAALVLGALTYTIYQQASLHLSAPNSVTTRHFMRAQILVGALQASTTGVSLYFFNSERFPTMTLGRLATSLIASTSAAFLVIFTEVRSPLLAGLPHLLLGIFSWAWITVEGREVRSFFTKGLT